MSIKELFSDALGAARRRRNLILLFVLAHVVFLFFGIWAMAKGFPAAQEMREGLMKAIEDAPYLQPLQGALVGSLALRVLYTFLFNLVVGAFFSTTALGALFFVPYIIAVWRGFAIGVLVQGLDLSALQLVAFYGTFILEFGAYSVSSAVGTDIGLSLLWPARKRAATRKDALLICLRDDRPLYVIVVILLFLGALWEMGWLQYLGPLVKKP